MSRSVSGLAVLALISAASWTAGCSSATPTREVTVGGASFQVEVADDFEERARGLMFRERLGPGQGMLFVHEREEPLAYWMKNTKIPLDILYFDASRRLVSIQKGVPPCSAGDRCPNYPSTGPAKYVLEVNAGEGQALNLLPGAEITFAKGVPETGQP